MGEQNLKEEKQLLLRVWWPCGCGKDHPFRGQSYIPPAPYGSWGRVIIRTLFWIHISWNGPGGSRSFPSRQSLHWEIRRWTLLDTPGHVDFSAEMERTLQVLDYVVLVINGADGVQGHTETLWRLLKRYRIPVFLFVNKMDQPGTDREALLSGLKRRLDSAVTDFTGVTAGTDGILSYSGDRENGEEFFEEISMAGEELLEEYLERGILSVDPVRGL